MKKLVISTVVGLLFAAGLSSMAGAACMGPFCWDDQGAYIGGTINDGNGSGTANLTKAQVAAATPRAKGQEVFCTDCSAFNSNKGYLCLSTGTIVGSYAAVSSATAIAACN